VFREAHSISEKSSHSVSLKEKIIRWAATLAYRRADFIIGISKGVAHEVVDALKVPGWKVRAIHNPAYSNQVSEADDSTGGFLKEGIVILGVGRLVPQKDFSTLLRAFTRVRRIRQAHLIILGEGKERKKLKTLARKLGVQDDVSMPGFENNPFAYMRSASIFVLSSRWEGFGNVLIEAMACGTPVVATDCQSGPAEILEGGRWGRLVPVGDDQAMADAILQALEKPTDREALQERAREFSPERIVPQYLDVLVNNA
jgi:glycosyltransferase involved in cell wall biosynthesis